MQALFCSRTSSPHIHTLHTRIQTCIHSPIRAMHEPKNAVMQPNETQEINCHSWQFPASSNLCRGSIPTVDLRFNALLNSLDHRCRLRMAGVRITTTDYEHTQTHTITCTRMWNNAHIGFAPRVAARSAFVGVAARSAFVRQRYLLEVRVRLAGAWLCRCGCVSV